MLRRQPCHLGESFVRFGASLLELDRDAAVIIPDPHQFRVLGDDSLLGHRVRFGRFQAQMADEALASEHDRCPGSRAASAESVCPAVLVGANLDAMKSNLLTFTFLLSAMLSLPPLTHPQDADKETDAALMQAAEAAKKMGMQMPDVKKIMEEDEKAEAKAKAKVQAVVSAPGPVAFPAWTPKVPDFTPAGPLTKKVIDDAPQIVQTGTSPLTPVALADAWEKFKNDKYRFSRTRSNINGTITQTVTYRNVDDTTQEVTMEVKREPSEKITHVTITSPLPIPKPADDE